MRPSFCQVSFRPPALILLGQSRQRRLVRRPQRLDGFCCLPARKKPQEPQTPGHRSAQELQAKAKVLVERQRQIAAELQQLQTEAEYLPEADQQLIQTQLSTKEDPETQVPEPVRDLFAEAGVLNAFPNDRPSSIDNSESYFQTPGNAQSYDWDLKMDTLDDIADPKEGESDGHQKTSGDRSSAGQDEDDHDDEGESAESNEDFEAGAGVEDMLRVLEEGGALPDIEGLMEAENPQEFQMRVQKLIDRYEAQFLKKKDRKISTEEIREMEREEAWQPTKGVPVIDKDITEVRPAPDIPADIQQQYDALQQCLYVLRRAHSTGRADEPAKALASAGLLDMAGLQFEDPLLACKGLAPWLLYMESLSSTGAWTEVEHLWAEVSDDRPNPVYTIMVDQFLNLPFPEWYFAEMQEDAPASAWDRHTGALRMPALFAVHESAPADPSIPQQQGHPQPQDPPSQTPSLSQSKRQATLAKGSGKQASTGKRVSGDHSQQDDSASKIGSITADAVVSDGGNSSSFSSSTGTPGWGFKTASPPGHRQTVAQTPIGQQAVSTAAEDKQEARLEQWPHLWYPPEQLIGRTKDSEFADEQRLVAKQVLHQKQQQESVGVEAANQIAPVTGTASSGPQTASKTEDLQLESPRQSAEPHLQQPDASVSSAGAWDATASGYLPKLDLLAQFNESSSSAEDHCILDGANVSEETAAVAAPGADADTVPAGCDQGLADSDEGKFGMMVNLNGAQVLTPDGWQSVSSRTPLGTAWEQGNCLTIGMTLQYHLSGSSGQIVAVTCGWATLDAFAWTIQDMMSLYIRCTGLHKW